MGGVEVNAELEEKGISGCGSGEKLGCGGGDIGFAPFVDEGRELVFVHAGDAEAGDAEIELAVDFDISPRKLNDTDIFL